jgi:cation diffusion facilitator CzcD-associated flavoprotein CzcO
MAESDGPKRLYSLRPEPFRELDAWAAAYRSLWEARLDRFAEALDRKQKARMATPKETAAWPSKRRTKRRRAR